MTKKVLILKLYLTKINEYIHTGTDGIPAEMELFGVNLKDLERMSAHIEKLLNRDIETAPEILDELMNKWSSTHCTQSSDRACSDSDCCLKD